MSQTEFDGYLALLLKSLKLRSGRSGALADELRDHLESRLEEVLASGKSRDEAIRLALEEFGDASELAAKFSRLAKSRRRRFLMRCTVASSLVVAGVLLAVVSLMPIIPDGPGLAPVVGQQEAHLPGGPAAAIASSGPGDVSIEQQAIAALDHKLSREVKVDFDGVLLKDAIKQLAKQIEADVIISKTAIEEEGLSVDETVTLQLEHTQVTARAAFGFILEPAGLALANRSGVIFITTETEAEELLVVKVYNVRDLIERAAPSYETLPPRGLRMEDMGRMEGTEGMGGGMFSIPDQIATATLAGSIGQIGGGLDVMGAGMVLRQPNGSPEQNAMFALTSLIRLSTSGEWRNPFVLPPMHWGGTIQPFDGLLVVRQTEEVHNEVQKLFDGLRAANRSGPGSSVTLPKGKPPREKQASKTPGLRDLSWLRHYHLDGNARYFLLDLASRHPRNAGTLSQLEILREFVVPLEAGGSFLSVVPEFQHGIPGAAWQAALLKAKPLDQQYGSLKDLLNDAKVYAGHQDIELRHILFALLDRDEGPIPEVLAAVGYTPRTLRQELVAGRTPSYLAKYELTPSAFGFVLYFRRHSSDLVDSFAPLDILNSLVDWQWVAEGREKLYLGVNVEDWKEAIEHARTRNDTDESLEELFNAVESYAGNRAIRPTDFLRALLDYDDETIRQVLEKVGLTPEQVRKRFEDERGKQE